MGSPGPAPSPWSKPGRPDRSGLRPGAADPAPLRGAPPEGGDCWATTIEAVKPAPSTPAIHAEVVRRNPRLLAFFLSPRGGDARRAEGVITAGAPAPHPATLSPLVGE